MRTHQTAGAAKPSDALLSYSLKTAAGATSLSQDTLRRRMDAGLLRGVVDGGRILILRTDLEAYLATLPELVTAVTPPAQAPADPATTAASTPEKAARP